MHENSFEEAPIKRVIAGLADNLETEEIGSDRQ